MVIGKAIGVWFTLIENETGLPEQPNAFGGMVMIAQTGALEVLVAIKEGMFPTPEDARPMLLLLLVQVKEVEATVPIKFTKEVAEPLHICLLYTSRCV